MAEVPFEIAGKKIWVAGHRGMVGSAIVRRLRSENVSMITTATSSEVDLRRQDLTEAFVLDSKPDVAVLAAATVGGIQANQIAQGRFLYDNLMIMANSIEACRLAGVDKVVVLGSSCIYPRDAKQPIREEYLLTGPLEATNEGYAVAKIAALELGKMYLRQYGMDIISLMPSNLYGPGDNYDLETSHVLPALLRKAHEAKVEGRDEMTVWGTGRPRREFLHVDDLADSVVFSLKNYRGETHLNVGTGSDISIADLAALIARIVGWEGRFLFDTTKPDGTQLKRLDVSTIQGMGWEAKIGLEGGITDVYEQFLLADSVTL